MGTSQIKDQNISIYMTTNKPYYMAGQYVEGQIFLRSLQPSNYLRILVGLEGQQYVQWSQGQGKSRRYYTNKYKNYDHQFVIRELNGNLQKGDYVFPFSFLLPKMMTGSFYDSKNCYIKYTLSAILFHPNEPRRSQIYNVPLNILEPPRMCIAPATSTQMVQSKCCHCCKNYGHTQATLSCDKNFIRNGDHISINGKIDNTRGMKDIKYSKVVLERIIFMATERGKVKTKMMENVQLFRMDKIASKDSKSFFFNAVVSDVFKVPTAIGRIVSNYYLLHLYTQYGCCANKAQAKIHLIFHSTTPIVRQQQFAPQPQNWYPQKFPTLIYNNMMPYCYTPQIQIPFLNLWKSDGFVNLTQNQQTGQNFMINENVRNPLIQNQQQFGLQQPYFAQNNYSRQTYENKQSQNMLYPDLNSDDRNLDSQGIYRRL